MKYILFFLLAIECFSQDGIEVIYKYESNFQKELTDDFMGKMQHKTKSFLPKIDFLLRATSKESIYKADVEMVSDGMQQKLYRLMIRSAKSNGLIYNNRSSNTSLHETNAFGRLYRIKSDFDGLDWKLEKATKHILGFTCKKATLEFYVSEEQRTNQKREIVAWFTSELPYPYGPSVYRGLPGLILELEVNWNFGYTLTAVEINKNDFIDIEEPKNGKIISESEYNQIGRQNSLRFKQ
jgi:GLPGLI family protein